MRREERVSRKVERVGSACVVVVEWRLRPVQRLPRRLCVGVGDRRRTYGCDLSSPTDRVWHSRRLCLSSAHCLTRTKSDGKLRDSFGALFGHIVEPPER